MSNYLGFQQAKDFSIEPAAFTYGKMTAVKLNVAFTVAPEEAIPLAHAFLEGIELYQGKPGTSCEAVEKHLQTCELHPVEEEEEPYTGPSIADVVREAKTREKP